MYMNKRESARDQLSLVAQGTSRVAEQAALVLILWQQYSEGAVELEDFRSQLDRVQAQLALLDLGPQDPNIKQALEDLL